jgi:hypothetical protein
MFLIKLADGDEIHGGASDELTISQETGVLSICRVDGFEETTTHYSPSAWLSVTHRKRDVAVRPSLVTPARKGPPTTAPAPERPAPAPERTATSQ